MEPTDHPSPAQGTATAETDLSPALRAALPGLDQEALAAFFDLYFPRVHGYLRRLLRDEHLAEDLTQDVFLHVHRALPSYDPERPLRPWVFTIATNKVRDYWRSRRHRQSQSEESVEEAGWADSLAEEGPLPGDALESLEVDEALREAVERLPEGMRVTVLLRVFEGLTFEQIGETIGRNEVAARKRFSRALTELRRLMDPVWDAANEGAGE